MQTVLTIADADLQVLDELSDSAHLTREELMSSVITEYIKTERQRRIIRETFGSMPHLEDGLAFQERMRGEWA